MRGQEGVVCLQERRKESGKKKGEKETLRERGEGKN